MSSVLRWVSNVGDTAYKTASKTGLTAGTEQPPYPCALPLHTLHDVSDVAHVEALLDCTFASVQDMMHDMHQLNDSLPPSSQKSWRLLDIADPDGDLRLYTRSHVGPYNFAKATMSLAGVPPQLVLMCMHAQDYHVRRRYSDHLKEYAVLARNPSLPHAYIGNDDRRLDELAMWGIRDWYVEYNHLHAPPPVASRDLVFLVEKRYVAAEDRYYIYGCSVDYVPYRKRNPSCVRAIAMWGWQLTPVGGHSTLATYVTCMNPNGWTPTFIIGWMQMAIAKELRCSRALLYEDSKAMATVVQEVVLQYQQQQQRQQQQQQQRQQQQHVVTEAGHGGLPMAPTTATATCSNNNSSNSNKNSHYKTVYTATGRPGSHAYGPSHHVSSSSYCSNSTSNLTTSSCMVDNDDVGGDDDDTDADPGAIAAAALYMRDTPPYTSLATPVLSVAATRQGRAVDADGGSAKARRTAAAAAMDVEDARCYVDDEEPLYS